MTTSGSPSPCSLPKCWNPAYWNDVSRQRRWNRDTERNSCRRLPAAPTALTFTAQNGNAPDATQTFTLTVNQAAADHEREQYHLPDWFGSGSFTCHLVRISGCEYWRKSGTLPSGVTFTDNHDGNFPEQLSGHSHDRAECSTSRFTASQRGRIPARHKVSR